MNYLRENTFVTTLKNKNKKTLEQNIRQKICLKLIYDGECIDIVIQNEFIIKKLEFAILAQFTSTALERNNL